MTRVLPEITDAHSKAMRERGNSFNQFMRNGVWGTCVACPRDSNHHAYPEFCEHAMRSDNHLTIEGLVQSYHAHGR